MSEELIKRLRNAADAIDSRDPGEDAPWRAVDLPFDDWTALMDEAADALEAYEDE